MLQELAPHPFWMLVACVLMNRTRREQAEPVWRELRERWPSKRALARAPLREVQAVVEPLGLSRRRSRDLVALARSYPGESFIAGPDDVAALPGCGRYAADCWAVLVDGDLSVEPTDGVLALRVRELRAKEE